MDKEDLEALKNWLDRTGNLPRYQEDLIDDAIFSVQHGSMYRAEQALKTMARNYRNENNSDAEKAVERLL